MLNLQFILKFYIYVVYILICNYRYVFCFNFFFVNIIMIVQDVRLWVDFENEEEIKIFEVFDDKLVLV